MRSTAAIRERITELESFYDEQDPPSSPMEDEQEAVLLRAIEELEWVLEEREDPPRH
ncbi:hypothetical protein [Halalkalicoccus subterraneus]|uniref:hypothetical protein n=1 Tax=Halalkalicoccus subterraneus TaxID=2675002 RepID=UPI0013CE6390|nr:hypothetical protein [Halalkalicoccus subterraneus]